MFGPNTRKAFNTALRIAGKGIADTGCSVYFGITCDYVTDAHQASHQHPTAYDLAHNRAGEPYPVTAPAIQAVNGAGSDSDGAYDNSPYPAPTSYVTLSDVPWGSRKA